MATRLRADARRNRAALLAAAREVFAEQGLDASLDEIARRAGVGNATLYRRFPSRRHLIAEVFASHMTAAVHLAEQALDHPDPWAAFVGYLTRVCELQATDDDERLATLRSTAQQRAADVLTRAQRAGRLRADFTGRDFALLMMANAGVAQHSADPQAWRRALALVIGGLGAKAM
jgi:AcrR family transcriptional regulator